MWNVYWKRIYYIFEGMYKRECLLCFWQRFDEEAIEIYFLFWKDRKKKYIEKMFWLGISEKIILFDEGFKF